MDEWEHGLRQWLAEQLPSSGDEPDGPRSPIVVWCNHGIADERGDFVQRYRWVKVAGGPDRSWEATDKTDEGETWPGERETWPLAPGQNPVALGSHWVARCKMCGRLVAMNSERADRALTTISGLGQKDISLHFLQRVYDQTS